MKWDWNSIKKENVEIILKNGIGQCYKNTWQEKK